MSEIISTKEVKQEIAAKRAEESAQTEMLRSDLNEYFKSAIENDKDHVEMQIGKTKRKYFDFILEHKAEFESAGYKVVTNGRFKKRATKLSVYFGNTPSWWVKSLGFLKHVVTIAFAVLVWWFLMTGTVQVASETIKYVIENQGLHNHGQYAMFAYKIMQFIALTAMSFFWPIAIIGKGVDA